jgi:hypothetical protein
MTLGSLMKSLPANEIQSISAFGEPASVYCQSVDHLMEVIRQICVEELSPKHLDCNPIRSIIKEIRAKKQQVEESIITKEFNDHLSQQKKKTGFIVWDSDSESE